MRDCYGQIEHVVDRNIITLATHSQRARSPRRRHKSQKFRWGISRTTAQAPQPAHSAHPAHSRAQQDHAALPRIRRRPAQSRNHSTTRISRLLLPVLPPQEVPPPHPAARPQPACNDGATNAPETHLARTRTCRQEHPEERSSREPAKGSRSELRSPCTPRVRQRRPPSCACDTYQPPSHTRSTGHHSSSPAALRITLVRILAPHATSHARERCTSADYRTSHDERAFPQRYREQISVEASRGSRNSAGQEAESDAAAQVLCNACTRGKGAGRAVSGGRVSRAGIAMPVHVEVLLLAE